MLFENPPIDFTTLPASEELNYKKLDSKYLKVKMINHLIFYLLLLIAAIVINVLNPENGWGIFHLGVFGVWLLLYVFSLLFIRKAFGYKGFALREKDIIYKRGWLWKSTLIVPFNRIQHCELSQGPFEKMYNLARLNVFTAGGQGSDLKLPGLEVEEANKIKEFLVNQINEFNFTES